jgi:hypothetical protein
MRTIFYEHLTFGDPTPAGAVTLEHGVAQIPIGQPVRSDA